MSLTITALAEKYGCTLGAEVRGVHLAALNDTHWQTLQQAFLEHALLVFPAQHLNDEQQLEFARGFGEIEVLVEGKTTIAISNRGEQGQPLRDDSVIVQLLRGNEGWHTDSSYMPLAAKASVLQARIVTPEGGETEWADMRAAYDALDVDMRARLERLSAYHSLFYSQSRIGAVAQVGDYYGFNAGDAPRRPLVKIHPETGRRALFIGRHACNIPGMDAAESEALLDGLMDFACRAPRVYRHRWQPGDIVVWDNRCLLHRARPYDYSLPRVMMHTRVRGNPATETALEK
jgi:alpha-ketoglutarate-dependent taurine dioxygenase